MSRQIPRKRKRRSLFALPLPRPSMAPGAGSGNPVEVRRALVERVKELNCLYAITELAEPTPKSVAEFLEGLVGVLPASWQFPENACARVTIEGLAVTSEPFEESPWRLAAPIVIWGDHVGMVEVFYQEERPPSYEGPFLFEERALLNAVAVRAGHTVERIHSQRKLHEAHRRLQAEQQALQEANSALRVMLSRLEEEKRVIRSDIQSNVTKILLPLLDELSTDPNPKTQHLADLLRRNLVDIASPFVNELAAKFATLTPTEIQICNMVRGGLRTKDIAAIRRVSPSTIHRHRERIRRKLGIANREVNLITFLESVLRDPP